MLYDRIKAMAYISGGGVMPKKPAVNREDKRKKEYLESSQDFLKHEKEEFKQYSIFLKDVNTAIEENQDKYLGSAGIARLKKSYEQAMDFTHNLISKKTKMYLTTIIRPFRKPLKL